MFVNTPASTGRRLESQLVFCLFKSGNTIPLISPGRLSCNFFCMLGCSFLCVFLAIAWSDVQLWSYDLKSAQPLLFGVHGSGLCQAPLEEFEYDSLDELS